MLGLERPVSRKSSIASVIETPPPSKIALQKKLKHFASKLLYQINHSYSIGIFLELSLQSFDNLKVNACVWLTLGF